MIFLINIDNEVESIINQQESNSNISDIYTAVAYRLFERANTTYDILSVKNSQMKALAEKYKAAQQKVLMNCGKYMQMTYPKHMKAASAHWFVPTMNITRQK